MKKQKIDERTQKALDTIKYGDKVCFFDCFEAIVYKDATFRVLSEYPRIDGTHVLVNLSNLGWVSIGRLKRVDNELVFSDAEMRNAMHCCGDDIDHPNCKACAYKIFPAEICSLKMIKDNQSRIQRREEFLKYKKGGAV